MISRIRKGMIVLLILLSTQASFAQLNSIMMSRGKYGSYNIPNPDVIDTASIRKLSNNFYAGNAWLDNMPVVLPGKTTRSMPNSGKNRIFPEKMPNAWQGSRPDSGAHKPNNRYPLIVPRSPKKSVNKPLRLPNEDNKPVYKPE